MDSKIFLSEQDLPSAWYNVQADLPWDVPPPKDPATRQPLKPEQLYPIFPKSLVEQELSKKKWHEIPAELMDVYKLWRVTPLHRAYKLERFLKTPARIYYKNESVSPPGSHKPNTAVAQAYFNKKEGVERIATETGAGQWGSALSFACNIFGIKCVVYMVKISYQQKPYRRDLMHIWNAEVYPSPTDRTESGRSILKENPSSYGSLGIAISEAVEEAAKNDNTKYSLGSVLNHVLMHQTVVGLETQKQLKIAGESPDVLIGCVGGGSNFAGFCLPFVPDKLKGKKIRFIAVEPTATPSFTKGQYLYDYGDTVGLTPLLKMYTLGHKFVPAPIHAGGLRYHGNSPLLSLLVHHKVIDSAAYHQNPVFEAALTFARTEGIIPAPETAHAIKCAIDEAIRCRQENKEECIVFNFSGHGHFDLLSYDKYLSGTLEDYELSDQEIAKTLKGLAAD
ncbi:MAG: TrpB-like pyridoxal phosphate-dependent enzyme [Candidatus Omnitrophica bacterium]|nr:TrpB-like pyridoxal phosphate-dependent enzyme [Candidatus Omnitrophota bacterium]